MFIVFTKNNYNLDKADFTGSLTGYSFFFWASYAQLTPRSFCPGRRKGGARPENQPYTLSFVIGPVTSTESLTAVCSPAVHLFGYRPCPTRGVTLTRSTSLRVTVYSYVKLVGVIYHFSDYCLYDIDCKQGQKLIPFNPIQ